MNDLDYLAAMLAALALILFGIVIWTDHTEDEPEYYSLIVTDYTGHQWAVDYNLTLPDCESMKVSPAAECSLQPEGKLP